MARIAGWWRRQAPHRQDRYAMLAPLATVVLFLAAIIAAFGYLRLEEMERELETVRRDVEYAHQSLRLRLTERQEQLVRIAGEISSEEISESQFRERAAGLIAQYPDLQRLAWFDEAQYVRASYGARIVGVNKSKGAGSRRDIPSPLAGSALDGSFAVVKDSHQTTYVLRSPTTETQATLQLYIPLSNKAAFGGVLLAEYSVDGLYRYGIPSDVSARYAVSLLDPHRDLLAGRSIAKKNPAVQLLPWVTHPNEYEVSVSPVGNSLVIRAQAYRTSLGVIGSGLFWLVCVLSVLTAWMLIGNWRHTRRRMHAQQALVAETNFRRAMENSMPTGMRALDLQGRITYVNAAFCQMTGWSESELVGRTAPFPYWPDEDRELLTSRLEDELKGRIASGGFQMRVKRKDDSRFECRIYISPLIDARGHQTGWMTSMTDITATKRIREQLYASYERFTTVLEALDASVAVAPIGTDELLFANKKYRLWFSDQTNGLDRLIAHAAPPTPIAADESGDNVDAMAGLPTTTFPDVETESAEVYIEELGKWLEVRTRYLTWVDGRLAQMVIATDITPRRLAEEQAAAQTERAQTASRLITMGEMASSVAHELNQPLTAINNYCNGMVSRIKAQQINEEDLLGALEKTARQAQRAGQIIQRIRAFVKRSEPNWVLSDVGIMVSEAVELAEIELRRSNVRLTHQIAEQLPHLLVDPILIEQVLVNLLKNAAESIVQAHRPIHERRIELSLENAVIDGKAVVEFAVKDTGRGIEPKVMERLYEAFFTTKAEGMGIGLSLCRSIVESHQGRMRAENIYNEALIVGCSFSFWIPVPETNSAPAAAPQHTDKIAG